jgi:hypothetical protein
MLVHGVHRHDSIIDFLEYVLRFSADSETAIVSVNLPGLSGRMLNALHLKIWKIQETRVHRVGCEKGIEL